MASGWNLWVCLQCIGVASRCCYKEVQWSLRITDTLVHRPLSVIQDMSFIWGVLF